MIVKIRSHVFDLDSISFWSDDQWSCFTIYIYCMSNFFTMKFWQPKLSIKHIT